VDNKPPLQARHYGATKKAINMDQQQQAFLLQVSRQLETVLAACKQNGSAEVMVGSNRISNKLIQVKLVAVERVVEECNSLESET